MITVVVRLPEDLDAALERTAASMLVGKPDALRYAIVCWLENPRLPSPRVAETTKGGAA